MLSVDEEKDLLIKMEAILRIVAGLKLLKEREVQILFTVNVEGFSYTITQAEDLHEAAKLAAQQYLVARSALNEELKVYQEPDLADWNPKKGDMQ